MCDFSYTLTILSILLHSSIIICFEIFVLCLILLSTSGAILKFVTHFILIKISIYNGLVATSVCETLVINTKSHSHYSPLFITICLSSNHTSTHITFRELLWFFKPLYEIIFFSSVCIMRSLYSYLLYQ